MEGGLKPHGEVGGGDEGNAGNSEAVEEAGLRSVGGGKLPHGAGGAVLRVGAAGGAKQ